MAKAIRSPARPLDETIAEPMGLRLGHDFSRVRVHTDEAAANAAASMRAKAFAVGHDLVFGFGRFAPGTPEGARLLAHELAHVTQTARGGDDVGAEERADRAAERVVRGERVAPILTGGAGPGAHLQEDPEARPGVGSSTRLDLTVETFNGFDHGQAALKPDHAARVRFLADLFFSVAIGSPGSKLVLTGHTDATGGERANLELGRKRAAAVAAALATAGVPVVSLQIESAGEAEPVVDTPEREPRNRRVEARIESPAGGAARKVDLFRQPSLSEPGLAWPKSMWDPGAPSKPLWKPKGTEGPPKAGSAGDLADALFEVPAVKALIDSAKEKAAADWSKLKPGEKVLVGGTAVSIAAVTAAGVGSDPAARKTALDALDGKELPVPGLPWLKLQVKTKDPGGMIKVDLIKLFEQR